MLRKFALAGLAALSLAGTTLATATPAEAYWHHHGGYWHHGGFGLGGLALGLGLGLGFAGPGYGWGYPHYGYAPYYYEPQPYYGYYESYPPCSLQRVRTPWGWRWRRICY